jgi:hypothetical protein
MTGLTIFWGYVSFAALRGLSSITGWPSFGPMDWLCILLLSIHVLLIVTTLWIWLHPKAEMLVVSTAEDSNRLFPGGLLIGMAGIWLAARLSGWMFTVVAIFSAIALLAFIVALCRDIRAARRLARRLLEKQTDASS